MSFLGNSVLFIPHLPEDYGTFMGHIRTTEEVRQSYQIEEVFYVIDMPQKLKVAILFQLNEKLSNFLKIAIIFLCFLDLLKNTLKFTEFTHCYFF